MAFIEDLAPCHYFPLECGALTAVGWLNQHDGFPKGDVTEEFYRMLQSLCVSPWQPVVSLGWHTCELCQFDGPRFSDNVFIPYQGKIYVTPVAIVHYVAAHRYLPPQIFVDAILACPAMNSMEYKRALLANGGRSLVRTGM